MQAPGELCQRIQDIYKRPVLQESPVMVDVPLLLRDLMSPSQQAVTIAEHVKITDLVHDARIVAASPSAASWYGLASSDQLIGQWVSRVQHPDDTPLARLLSTARHRGLAVPGAYVWRVKHPDGAYHLVTKQVQQFEGNAQIYWVTVLSVPMGPPLQRAELQAHLGISDDEIRHTFGALTVVDVESLLGQGPLPPVHTMFATLPLGGTYELPLGLATYRRWIHYCQRCRKRWIAETASPRHCTHCTSPSWRQPPKKPRPYR